MIGNKYLFIHLEDKDLQVHIEMGDNGSYSTIEIDTVTFQRESGSPLTLQDVIYVLGLKKNLVFVAWSVD